MDEIIKELKRRIETAMASLREELSVIRGNRPSPALVEDVKIEYFENQVPLKQLGSISVVPPREIVISLWDPSNIEVVSKAIEATKRGFNPSVRGQSIYVTLPQLTQERRDELIKITKQLAEKYKIELRNFRDDANKRLSAGELTEDQEFKGKKDIQEEINKANKDVEEILQRKETEINE